MAERSIKTPRTASRATNSSWVTRGFCRSLAAPKVAFQVGGAPTDKVEMIFFYGSAPKTLLTAANQKTDEIIKNLGEQSKVKVANMSAQEQAKALGEVAAGTLNKQQKTAVGNAWSDLLASNLGRAIRC